jgi:16S rRNA (uracil1498-N3)-methyltransferase
MAAQRRIRLFLDRALAGDVLALDEREAHYLGRVLRLQRGAELVAFNGRGAERHAVVRALTKRGGELALGEALPPLPASRLDLTLLQGIAKAEAMDLIVQKATELGVRRIVPAETAYGVVRLDPERAARRTEHWQRIAHSACEQSGRHEPPRIDAPLALADAVRDVATAGLRLTLEPRAAAPLRAHAAASTVVLAVGPEGGLSTADLALLDAAGFVRASLGPRVLRAETAAIAACAAAQLLWGDS